LEMGIGRIFSRSTPCLHPGIAASNRAG
jgi:hypothetical protein